MIYSYLCIRQYLILHNFFYIWYNYRVKPVVNVGFEAIT